jgi:hypothetical protein
MYALSAEQIDQVSGAIDWGEVGVGAGLIGLGITFTVVSGGTAALPVMLIAGAGTGAEIAAGAAALGLSALGGYAMGSGFIN